MLGLSLVLAFGALLWGFAIEPYTLRVREEALALPDWRGPPLRVAVLTDLHVGAPGHGLTMLRRIVARTNAARPDVVVILGDLVIQGVVGGRFVPPEAAARELAALRAPGGVWAVLGNHDGWLDATRVRQSLEAAGIPVLANAARPLPGTGVWVAGLEDLWTGRPDAARALADVPMGAPVVLLTHNPDVFGFAGPSGAPDVPARVALTLAGHTHGGQVRVPFVGRPVVPSRYGGRYAAGHVEEGGRHLFVATGTGTSILPVRFGVPPEVVVLTLVAPD